jgi:putative membrane protein
MFAMREVRVTAKRLVIAIAAIGLASSSSLMIAGDTAVAQTNPAAPPAASIPGAMAQPGLTNQDREFVERAAQSGRAEIELGKLAQKSANPDVRHFADQMIADHNRADARLTAIAQAKGIELPATLDIDHRKLRDKLATEHDGNFNRDYAHAMVVDHDQAIKLFEGEAASGGDRQLQEFARDTLPTLQEHRNMAGDLAAKLGSTAAR